jgi:hypothetical protein
MNERKRLQDSDIREDDIPLRNPSVRAYQTGGDAVLHDAERDQVFAVTALAGEMWERCDGHTPLAEIGGDIREQRTEDRPLPEIMDTLRQAATHLRTHDLLFVLGDNLTGRGDPAGTGDVKPLRVVFGAHHVTVRASTSELARAVRRVFRGMLGGESGGDPSPETIDMLAAGLFEGQYSVRGVGGMYAQYSTLDGAVRGLKHAVLRRFMEARPDLIWLHAGAATQGGTAVLVAGPWGSGKSTVIADLCRSGWTYLSDDMAPYAPYSGTIWPFPTTLAYREPGEEPLSQENLAGRPKTHVDLQPERIQDAPVRPEAIFFPTFDPDHPADATKRAAAEAAVSLVEQCQNAGRYRGEAVRQLCELASRIPAFQLHYNGQSDISDLVTSALR